ncbi:MAG: DUF2997 domain-containing protein [Candidatus Muirbacterium halophilum]|nr:DUF2997 domain-containing protein [Candidatus Muirbacterium halophilum]MCK9477404.1 DUF2997 domain-containing protein [Candidatus Muirbacterium halophilum]
MSKKLIIKILPDGRIEANTSGIKGKECLSYIKILEELLDAETYKSEFTEEYYEKNIVNNDVNIDNKINQEVKTKI